MNNNYYTALRTTIKLRCDTDENFKKANILLQDGEIAFIIDNDKNDNKIINMVVGDGDTSYSNLKPLFETVDKANYRYGVVTNRIGDLKKRVLLESNHINDRVSEISDMVSSTNSDLRMTDNLINTMNRKLSILSKVVYSSTTLLILTIIYMIISRWY